MASVRGLALAANQRGRSVLPRRLAVHAPPMTPTLVNRMRPNAAGLTEHRPERFLTPSTGPGSTRPIEHVARHDRQTIGGLGDRIGAPGQGPHCVSEVQRLDEYQPAGAAGRSEHRNGESGPGFILAT